MKFSKLETIVILLLVIILVISIVLAPKGSYIKNDKTDNNIAETAPEITENDNEKKSEETLVSNENNSDLQENVESYLSIDENTPSEEHTEDDVATTDGDRDAYGLTLCVENTTKSGLTYYFIQNGGNPTGELNYGSYYIVERFIDGEWIEVDYIIENVGWTAEAYIIPKDGASAKIDINWEWLYGELESGEYRFGKSVMDFRTTGDYDTKMYYVKFVI